VWNQKNNFKICHDIFSFSFFIFFKKDLEIFYVGFI